MATSPIRIGVLLLPPVQLLDVSAVDLFGMLTKDYLTACRLPQPLINGALPIEIKYISESGGDNIEECTASAGLRVTAGFEDAGSAPGHLDILLVPGPDPATVPSEGFRSFLNAHAQKGTTILSICTGIFPTAYAGVVKSKQATGPRALLVELRKTFPETKWHERRWIRDGNVWTSGKGMFPENNISGRPTLMMPFSRYHKWNGHGRCLYASDLAWSHGRGST